MTDKAKPPQPMAFKNLSELKRYIKLGTEFKATRHKYHPDIVGLTRVVTKVQTNGFYSKIKDEPNHRFSDCNGGKGFFTELGKAGGYRKREALPIYCRRNHPGLRVVLLPKHTLKKVHSPT